MFYIAFKTRLKLLSFVLCNQCRELNQEQTVKEGVKRGLQCKSISDKISCYRNVGEHMGKREQSFESRRQRVTFGDQ